MCTGLLGQDSRDGLWESLSQEGEGVKFGARAEFRVLREPEGRSEQVVGRKHPEV